MRRHLLYEVIDLTESIINYSQWPRRDDGSPIFNSTNDAFFYAELIYSNVGECNKIYQFRFNTLYLMEIIRSNKNADLQDLFDLAFRSQFFRECLEEVNRIINDHSPKTI